MELEDMEKKNIYKVPEGYFDDFLGNVQKKITTEQKYSPSFVYQLKNRFEVIKSPSVLTAIGVIVVTLFAGWQIAITYLRQQDIDYQVSKLSRQDIIEYFENSPSSISSEPIYPESKRGLYTTESVLDLSTEMQNESDNIFASEDLEVIYYEYVSRR